MRIKFSVVLLLVAAHAHAEAPRAETDGVDAMGIDLVSEVQSPTPIHIDPPKSDGVENMVGTDVLKDSNRLESPGLKKLLREHTRKAPVPEVVPTIAAQTATNGWSKLSFQRRYFFTHLVLIVLLVALPLPLVHIHSRWMAHHIIARQRQQNEQFKSFYEDYIDRLLLLIPKKELPRLRADKTPQNT